MIQKARLLITTKRYYNTLHKNCDSPASDRQPGLEAACEQINTVALTKNDNSLSAIALAKLPAQAIQKDSGQWEQFFLDFRQEMEEKLNQAEARDQEAARRQQQMLLQNKMLYEQNQGLEAKLQYIEERERQREREENERQLLKQKRKQAKTQPLREAITPVEFIQILEIAQTKYKEPLTNARVKVAIALLYLTGLRISNLLLFQKRHLDQLVEEGECEISIIKGGAKRQILHIGAKGQQLLRKLGAEREILGVNQPESNKPVFSGKLNLEKSVSKRIFRKQVNGVLQDATVLLKKHFRSHSFRATYVTDLLNQGVPIEKVRDLIGHSNINTTARYARHKVALKEVRSTTTTLNKGRFGGA